ncbi:lytic transglycosylase domain-containing protein [Candidatus Woesearchaeota archaeon]|nr:lytic transglycosylase domain-containing protein [Candidatus Woesearchaeota archaeon]
MRLGRLLYIAFIGNTLLGPIDSNAKESTKKYIDSIVEETIEKYDAHRYNITPELVSSMIFHESTYDSLAVSKKGAMGLMQLMPKTAAELGVKNPFDPRENIDGGVRMLIGLSKRYDNNRTALAAYNRGKTKVDTLMAEYGHRWWNELPSITRRYVKNVLGYAEE